MLLATQRPEKVIQPENTRHLATYKEVVEEVKEEKPKPAKKSAKKRLKLPGA